MATRLGEEGTLRRTDEVASTAGRGLRRWGGIRLHDGSSRAANRAETASRAEEGSALSDARARTTRGTPNEYSSNNLQTKAHRRHGKPHNHVAAGVFLTVGNSRQNP